MSTRKTHLNTRMPKAPAPKCSSCGRPLNNVRMGRNERVGTNMKVECLAICGNPVCNAEHRGERILDITHGRMKFLSQRFWIDEGAVAERKKQEAQAEVREAIAEIKEPLRKYWVPATLGLGALAGGVGWYLF